MVVMCLDPPNAKSEQHTVGPETSLRADLHSMLISQWLFAQAFGSVCEIGSRVHETVGDS